MRVKILLFLCFFITGSVLLAQPGGADQPPVAKNNVLGVKVRLMGFGFSKVGATLSSKQVMKLVDVTYIKGEKPPYKGQIRIGIVRKMKTLPIRIHSDGGGVDAIIVKIEEKVVEGVKKLIETKIGNIKFKNTTTEYKEKIQTGKIVIDAGHDETKTVAGHYTAYMNLLKEIDINATKKKNTSSATSTNNKNGGNIK